MSEIMPVTMSQTGWLIERRDRGLTEWLIPYAINSKWTTDSSAAIRFARREDAETFVNAFMDPGPDVFITNHMWTDPRPRPPSVADLERMLPDEMSIEKIVSEAGAKLRSEVREILCIPDESRQVVTTFYKGDTPPVERGRMRAFIVTVRRKPYPGRSRDVFTFPACYLNHYPLHIEDGCGAENCEDQHDDGCPETGWFEDRIHPDYESCYYKLLGEGDEVIEWAELPGPPE